jgi:L-fuconolactonase
MSSPERFLSRRALLKSSASATALATLGTWSTSRAMDDDLSKTLIVDPHVHVWKNDPRYPWPDDLKDPPKEDALPSTLLDLMAANGVSATVIVHVIYYRWDCRYAGDTIKARRDKFQGVCRVNPTADTAPDDLDHWVRDYGFQGVRLSPAAGSAGAWINDQPHMDAIFRRSAERKIPMCILCPSARLGDVDRVVERHRDALDVCIDHMADCTIDRPDELKKLLALARFPRVFVKLSHLWSLSRGPYPYRDTFDQVKRIYDAFGPQRLMWGTDWPAVEKFCGYAKALALYRDEIDFFTPEDRRWILGATARRLWTFGSKG